MGISLADTVRILEVYDDRDQLAQFFLARQREPETVSQDFVCTAENLFIHVYGREKRRMYLIFISYRCNI